MIVALFGKRLPDGFGLLVVACGKSLPAGGWLSFSRTCDSESERDSEQEGGKSYA